MPDQVPIHEEVNQLATILRNLKCDVEVDHLTSFYRIGARTFTGPLSFISRARRALKDAGIDIPLP